MKIGKVCSTITVSTNAPEILEGFSMNRVLGRLAALVVAIMLLASVCASGEGSISTTVVMRVSRMAQNAVVKAGEDLSIEVGIDGVEPAQYQWYFNDVPIEGANQKVFNIVNAKPENTGVYRMDAFDANGKMLVSMDIAARVLEDTVPQAGDRSMPVAVAFTAILLCSGALVFLLKRRSRA